MNKLNHILRALFSPRPAFANVAAGVHEGGITKTLGEDVATRHLLGALIGSEVIINHSDTMPQGVITDSGEQDDIVNVALLATSPSTLLMVASEAFAIGVPVYADDDGKVRNQPNSAGECYQVGYAVGTASADGDLLEVAPHAPLKVSIISAFTGAATTDIAALGAALGDAPDKVIVLS
ncbi:capsid cement protein [Cerasicoccus frondis]|uniref:capsid cement protein n=1 Tax=Cerasicoccus frondis TaxID=490090 RepID=UPI002852697A|nr:capsid cement protein [Cerasicoccus frondis]